MRNTADSIAVSLRGVPNTPFKASGEWWGGGDASPLALECAGPKHLRLVQLLRSHAQDTVTKAECCAPAMLHHGCRECRDR